MNHAAGSRVYVNGDGERRRSVQRLAIGSWFLAIGDDNGMTANGKTVAPRHVKAAPSCRTPNYGCLGRSYIRVIRVICGKKAVTVASKNNRGGFWEPPRFRQINGSRTHNVDARGGGDACRTYRETEEVLGDLISLAVLTSCRLPLEPILYHRLHENYPCDSALDQIIPRGPAGFWASV